jgi:hypothetical protein
MANFTSYKTDRGEKRFLAVVRIKGFKRTSKAFDSMGDAKDWAQAYERELRGLRDRGGARADVTRLTVKDLVTAFLGDPKTQGRKYYPDLKYMLGSWVDEYGSERLRSFGYLQIVAFRDKRLATGLTPHGRSHGRRCQRDLQAVRCSRRAARQSRALLGRHRRAALRCARRALAGCRF